MNSQVAMKLSLKPAHLKRYKDIVTLFWTYGRSDVARDLGAFDETEDRDVAPRDGDPKPEQLADDLERMGPTYVKLGQLLSGRADLLPDAYLEALARLQDDVKPFPFGEVETIVEAELGVRLSKAFATFEAKPLAAASLGQVHAATMRDGRPVVVKVQRPGIKKQIVEDFEVLTELAAFADAHTAAGKRYRFGKIVDEMRTTLLQELDYEREASNLRALSENLSAFEHLHVPLPIADYSTGSVLTMDFVRGTKITKLSPLSRIDIDGEALVDELFRAYLQQVLVDGLFHADPHPGNVFLTDDGRIALLDLGMVGRVAARIQEELLKLTLALAEGNADDALKVMIAIGEAGDAFDEPELRRRAWPFIVEQRDTSLRKINVGRAMLGLARIGADTGLHAPANLVLLGKALMQLDQIGKVLAPEFDPNAAVQRHASAIMTQRMWKNLSPGNLLAPALELKDFLTGLPNRLNKILDAVGNAELELKVKAPDTEHLLKAFQKIANRITTGLIIAAMIVGASLLMQVDTPFRLFGYPGLAMLFFLAAAGGGIWLVLDVVVKDYKDRERARR
jgi:predicted unusual protein kinase regulating ubiquinone biosynthesis (AarF/ABC1/UbiB family)